MFDHKGVKTIKNIEIFFAMSNPKSWSPKKYEIEKPNKPINPNQFVISQNRLYNFF